MWSGGRKEGKFLECRRLISVVLLPLKDSSTSGSSWTKGGQAWGKRKGKPPHGRVGLLPFYPAHVFTHNQSTDGFWVVLINRVYYLAIITRHPRTCTVQHAPPTSPLSLSFSLLPCHRYSLYMWFYTSNTSVQCLISPDFADVPTPPYRNDWLGVCIRWACEINRRKSQLSDSIVREETPNFPSCWLNIWIFSRWCRLRKMRRGIRVRKILPPVFHRGR